MKASIATVALAGAVSAAPQLGSSLHGRSAQYSPPSAPHPFQPHPYHGHHHNYTTPFGAASTAAAASGTAKACTRRSRTTPGSPAGSSAAAVASSSLGFSTPLPLSSFVAATPASSSAASASSDLSSGTPAAASSSAVSALASPSSSAGAVAGKVQAAGVNIAGCDFGCDTSGNCNSGTSCPTTVGPAQMQHFSSQDGLNIFRLPVGWQYLVANQLGGQLDQSYFSGYDGIVQSCLQTNSRCIIDIHNYARWNGQIVGQSTGSGGPTNDNLANLWSQLATHYASSSNVVFGIMNEPHDLDIDQWATTVQAAVTAIRQAGATSQWILLPGTSYTSAGGFQTSSAPALSKITNLDGSTDNLVYDVHNYYDSDSSGTNAECVTDHVSDRFQPLGDYLRSVKRQAFVSELGGGNTASCETNVCSSLDFLNSYSDVYLGWTGWAAGSFDSSYTLSEVPNGSTDTALVSQCIAGKFKSS